MARIGNAVIQKVSTQQGMLWELKTFDLHDHKLLETKLCLTKDDAVKYLTRYQYHIPLAIYHGD